MKRIWVHVERAHPVWPQAETCELGQVSTESRRVEATEKVPGLELAAPRGRTNLQSLHLGVATITNIAPLRSLKRLTIFRLNYGGGGAFVQYKGEVMRGEAPSDGVIGDLRPLHDLPALARVDIGNRSLDNPANRAEIKKLKDRGVFLLTPEEAHAKRVAEAQVDRRKSDVMRGVAAFKDKQYADVVARLMPHEPSLAPSERLKVEHSRKQLAKA